MFDMAQEWFDVWHWKSGDASSKRHLTKHARRFCWLTESIQSLQYEWGLRGPTDLSSCLFVNFGRYQAFSLYYFGCGMQQAFYQNPSVRKTLLSFVWWKPGEFTRFSPSFHQVLAFTKISPGFANSPGFHQFSPRQGPSLISSPSFHQVVYKNNQVFTKIKKNLVNSPNFDFSRFSPKIKKNTWWIHQAFTRFSPGFQISPSFHHKKNLVNSPGFHQVYKSHQVFTKIYKKLGEFIKLSPGFHQVLKFHQVFTRAKKQKPGEFTRFSPSFEVSPSFHQSKKTKTWWIHQAFTRFSNITKFSPQEKTWWIHQVFTRFWKFTKFSQKKTWWNHQVFTRFSKFTKFSPKNTWWNHQVFTKLWNFTSFQVNSPGFNQTWWIHQVFKLSPWWFFSSNSPQKRINVTKKMLKTLLLVNFSGAKRFLIFDCVIFQKLGEFTRFSPGFHQVFKFHQVFTPPKKMVNSPGFDEVFTRFSPGFQISPSFHQKKLGEFTRFSNFTKFSPKKTWWIHQVFTRFSPGFQISPSVRQK